MSQFEFVTVAIAMIMSFSLARTLSNVTTIFEAEERYWVHTLWVVLALVNHFTVFFGSGVYADVERFTFAMFCVILVNPLIVLLSSALLLPNRPVTNTREYMESIRGRFYPIYGLFVLAVQPTGFVLLDVSVDLRQLAFSVVFAAFLFVGAYVRRPRFDQLLVLTTALLVGSYVVVMWNTALFEMIEFPMVD